ncbi:MAG: penicillin-binding protein 2 [Coxiellaceae bacterium]|nr:penicillin-binding protein 2 [Coxiellaceae bacterium]
MQKLSIKNHLQETKLFQNRCLILLCIIAVILLAVVMRLVYLQVFQHGFYNGLSRHNVLDVQPIAPKRGLIYDRNGVLLAENVPSFTLTIIPEQVKDLDKTLANIKAFIPLSDDEIKRFKQLSKQHHRFDPIPLKFKLTEKQVDQFYVNQYRLHGVDIRAELIRSYPLGKITGNVVGYVGRINAYEQQHIDAENYSDTNYIGKTGIEKSFEDALHGTVGNETVETDASGREVHAIKAQPAQSGENLYLTIDSQLQKAAIDALGKQVGAAVVIQPSTGQVLAMVSTPNFDPNPFVTGLTQQQYDAIVNAPNHPLINRTIHGVFAAASTAKPFYALEGLNTGTISLKDRIYDRGWFKINNTHHIYHDWHAQGHGWVNVTKAIAVSCDTYFYHLAMLLGLHGLDHVLNQFGFGNTTGIALPGELPGLVPTTDWKMANQGHPWYTGDTVVAGIGQGYVLVTPLQLALATATLSEHGKRFKPQLILKTQSPDQAEPQLQPSSPLADIELKAQWMWKSVIKAMSDVVTKPYGTGIHFGHPHYTAAVKTGTAQVYGHTRDEYRVRTNLPWRLRNHSLFIAFAPVKQPQIAIAVVVEHDASAPQITRKIMDTYFKTAHLKDHKKDD